ncbi:MAG: hypothetical protein WC384_08675 [Prolixibacteraceae bacterium]|jgi:hypothetical protein
MLRLSFTIALIVWALASLAQSPHGEGFKIDCVSCHTSESWKVTRTNMTFDHNTTQFKLTGQHQFTDCKSCHTTLKFQEAKTECISCHTDMHQNTLGNDCARCHDTKAWIIEKTVSMHQMSRFPLLGNHAVADCSSCHTSASNFRYEPLDIECVSCHRADYNAAKSPDHLASGYSTNCIDCHGVKATGWTAQNFDHSFFPLTEGHGSVSCNECHTTGKYQKISTDCVSCHQLDFNKTTNPNHGTAGFSTSCTECHTTKPGWSPANFREHDAAYFPIYSGTHKGEWESCTDCHTTKTYSEFSCVSCHEHNQSESDDEHKGISAYVFESTSCYSCHPLGTKSGSFNHNTTKFPLTGAHLTVDCASCHTSGYAGTSMECKSCHQTNFNNAQTPGHVQAGISTDCTSCHTTTNWQPSTFKHGTTGFELSGAHATIVQCSACHMGSTSAAKPECITCHQAQYNSAPNHVASKYPTECLQCHNSNNWVGATFDHSKTNFPLTGAHVSVECASCHTSGYAGTSMECKSCHQTNFNNAQTPSHTQAGISTDCTSCHTTTNWQPSTFKHGTTGFELSGAHATIVQCSACHVGSTTTANPACITCHQAQYNSAPNHVASKYPTECLQCHNSNNWLGATFDHSKTNFPLTGAHVSVECASCHTTGYAGTSTACNSCHLTNYNSTTNPNHKTLGLSVNCTDCHTTNPGWQPAKFPNHSTYFALTGAHAAIANDCASCHNGVYTNTPNTCYACHTSDYNNTTNPAHKAAQFPTDCATCHTVNAWSPSTFNHDAQYFPIYSGKHQGKWTLCSECHTSPSNFTLFSCILCHEHNNKTSVDDDHSGVRNYTYTSTSCYSCHPTGQD